MSAGLHSFFTTAAQIAGTLIGLLFVAISVAHDRLTSEDADQAHRLRAAAALTSFVNALAVALFSLVPGVGLRWPTFILGLIGLSFLSASLLSLIRVGGVRLVARRDTLFLVGLLTVFVLQLVFALQLISNGRDSGAQRGIAILVIVCFLIGIARSWELIDAPSIRLTRELVALVRPRAHRRASRGPGESGPGPGEE